MRVTVLMPMGGRGQRFVDAGYTIPKPLISVDGAPMFLRALESFPAAWDIEHIFVIRSEHDRRYGMADIIRKTHPHARIVTLDHDTRGAAESCFAAHDQLDPTIPLIVADCDIRFYSKSYLAHVEQGGFDGLLVGFESSDPRYSYAQLDDEGNVMRTAEKVVISRYALLGGYCFSSGATFLDLARTFLEGDLPPGLGEYYLSHLFNLLIAQGKTVHLDFAGSFDIWGTPEELHDYQAHRQASS